MELILFIGIVVLTLVGLLIASTIHDLLWELSEISRWLRVIADNMFSFTEKGE